MSATRSRRAARKEREGDGDLLNSNYLPRVMQPLEDFTPKHFARIAQAREAYVLECETRIHELDELRTNARAERADYIATSCTIEIQALEEKVVVFGGLPQ